MNFFCLAASSQTSRHACTRNAYSKSRRIPGAGISPPYSGTCGVCTVTKMISASETTPGIPANPKRLVPRTFSMPISCIGGVRPSTIRRGSLLTSYPVTS